MDRTGRTTWKRERPRLFFDSEWVSKFQEDVRRDGTLAGQWAGFLKKAGELMNEEFVHESYADEPDTQHREIWMRLLR